MTAGSYQMSKGAKKTVDGFVGSAAGGLLEQQWVDQLLQVYVQWEEAFLARLELFLDIQLVLMLVLQWGEQLDQCLDL